MRTRTRQARPKAPASHLERAFAAGLRLYGADLPPHCGQHRFAPGRRYRADFAWPARRVAVELQGIFGGGKGGHRSLSRTMDDYRKLNTYAVLGWRVLLFAAPDLTQRQLPATVETVRRALGDAEDAREDVG